MIDISKETLENSDIEVVIDGLNTLWLNEKHIEVQKHIQLVHRNVPAITSKYNKIYKKHRYELGNEPIKQTNRRFLRIDLALKIIIDCRTDQSCSLKRNLGFNLHNVINTKKQTVLRSIKDGFEGEDMQNQYTVISYWIDLYFHKHTFQLKLMNQDMLIELFSIMKQGDKKHQKDNLIVYLLELILMQKI